MVVAGVPEVVAAEILTRLEAEVAELRWCSEPELVPVAADEVALSEIFEASPFTAK